MLIWNDDLEAAIAHADALLAACRPLGWASAVANCQWVRAMAALRAGRVAEAADDARHGVRVQAAVCRRRDSLALGAWRRSPTR